MPGAWMLGFLDFCRSHGNRVTVDPRSHLLRFSLWPDRLRRAEPGIVCMPRTASGVWGPRSQSFVKRPMGRQENGPERCPPPFNSGVGLAWWRQPNDKEGASIWLHHLGSHLGCQATEMLQLASEGPDVLVCYLCFPKKIPASYLHQIYLLTGSQQQCCVFLRLKKPLILEESMLLASSALKCTMYS